MMRIEVAHRAVPLAENLHGAPAALRAAQARDEVGDLLAERRRARGLTVRARQHRHVGFAAREGGELRRALRERGEHAPARLAEEARVAQIVDVLGGAAEMHELEGGLARPRGRELLADVILDCLDIVVDDRLDGLH